MCIACVQVCVPPVYSAHGHLKRASGYLELELQMAVSRVIWVLTPQAHWRNNHCHKVLSPMLKKILNKNVEYNFTTSILLTLATKLILIFILNLTVCPVPLISLKWLFA